jgi:Flp pilus assembly protein TadG
MSRPVIRTARFRARLARAIGRFGADTRGATAVEFALIALPFFVLVIGIITVGMQYLTSHSLALGVDVASRELRTGEAQKDGITVGQFRQAVCNAAGAMIACDERLVIHIKSRPTFAELMPITPCLTNGRLTPPEGDLSDGIRTRSGDASTAVVVSACYEWDAGFGPWQVIWNLLTSERVDRGKPIISAATAFRSEPFE